tara:strand:+ start:41746 stop:42156 length:411 start_codon:yes stop_codon:yes gene_type:complete
MVLEDHPVIKNHLDNNDIEISHANEDKIDENLNKIKKIREEHARLSKRKMDKKDIKKEEKEKEELKQLDIKKLDDNLIHKIITEKGTKEINYWYRFKYLIVFGSILFLMSLYFIFWYIATDFKTIEESFTSIFCVI